MKTPKTQIRFWTSRWMQPSTMIKSLFKMWLWMRFVRIWLAANSKLDPNLSNRMCMWWAWSYISWCNCEDLMTIILGNRPSFYFRQWSPVTPAASKLWRRRDVFAVESFNFFFYQLLPHGEINLGYLQKNNRIMDTDGKLNWMCSEDLCVNIFWWVVRERRESGWVSLASSGGWLFYTMLWSWYVTSLWEEENKFPIGCHPFLRKASFSVQLWSFETQSNDPPESGNQ